MSENNESCSSAQSFAPAIETEPCACCRALATKYSSSPDTGHVAKAPPLFSMRLPFEMGKGKSEKAKAHKHDSAANSASTGAAKADPAGNEAFPDTEEHADSWEESLVAPKQRKSWQGWDGLGITAFGVAVPALLTVLSCASAPKRLTLVLLNHPVETAIELLLIFAIPFVNFQLWRSLRKNDISFSPLRGIALGGTIASALVVSGICIAGLVAASDQLQSAIGTSFTTGFAWLSVLSALSAAAGIYLMIRFRKTREFPVSRNRIVIYTIVGFLLSIAAFAGAEVRPWCIRMAESLAESDKSADRLKGLQQLRALQPKRELLMECTDARAAGLAGLFIPLKSTAQHELYFATTGEPFSFTDTKNSDLSAMSDEYVSRHAVGEKIKGLSMVRSALTSTIHPRTLSTTSDWTLVFKNDSSSSQEARAEIAVPPGAVITGLTRWIKGEPRQSVFAAAGRVDGVTSWVEADHNTAAIATDMGRGRVLVHCYPVEPDEQLKLKITMVQALKPNAPATATLTLPSLIATNFTLSGEHSIRLRSSMPMSSTAKQLKLESSHGGEYALSGTIDQSSLEHLPLITANRPTNLQPIAALDTVAVELNRREEKAKEEAEKQRRLAQNATNGQQQVVVMIDGSHGLQHQLDDVTRALNAKKAGHGPAKPQIKVIPPQYVVQSVSQISSPPPAQLVVVVDGSVTMSSHVKEIVQGLSAIPKNVPVSMLIASSENPNLTKPMSLAKGIDALKSTPLIGGQDNLKAVVAAAELAGESKDGAVLWIHGPQPALNSDIYIMAPYIAPPAFYELPVDSGPTDTFDFFKNHSEIGPFTQVTQDGSLGKGLAQFFANWKSETADYAVAMTSTTANLENASELCAQEIVEVTQLHALQQVTALIASRHSRKAAHLAVSYGIVTPVSTTVVLADQPAHDDESNAETDDLTGATASDGTGGSPHSKFAPALQGATNGTIGPQGGDATYVTGLNTAGTVRVNNLANLEALLNIIANLCQIGCGLVGLLFIVHGLRFKGTVTELLGMPVDLGPGNRITIGVALLLAGMSLPGIINWFVASARDANLFN